MYRLIRVIAGDLRPEDTNFSLYLVTHIIYQHCASTLHVKLVCCQHLKVKPFLYVEHMMIVMYKKNKSFVMLSILGKISVDNLLKYFSYFFQKICLLTFHVNYIL